MIMIKLIFLIKIWMNVSTIFKKKHHRKKIILSRTDLIEDCMLLKIDNNKFKIVYYMRINEFIIHLEKKNINLKLTIK
jgi:hypothetical protein